MREILITAIFFSIIHFSGCIEPLPGEPEACIDEGGYWFAGDGEKEPGCVLPFPDAGIKCTQSSQCEGLCVTKRKSQLGIQGTCELYPGKRDCWNAVENDRFSCRFNNREFFCDDKKWDSLCVYYKGVFFYE